MAFGDQPKYKPDEHPAIIREMAEDMCTMREMGTALGVTSECIRLWVRDIPAVKAAWIAGRAAASDAVEKALFSRAKGYRVRAEKLITVSQPGGGSVVERHQVVEHYAPDTAAAKYWLNNRRPKEWKEAVPAGIADPDGHVHIHINGMKLPTTTAPTPEPAP